MKPNKKPPEELTMSAEEFDRMMRGPLQAPTLKKPPNKVRRAKKPKESAPK